MFATITYRNSYGWSCTCMRWGMLIKAQERQYYAARQAIGVQSGCLDNFNFVCEHEVKLFADNLTLLTKQSNFAASDWLEPGFGWVPVEIEIPTKSSVRSQFFGGPKLIDRLLLYLQSILKFAGAARSL